MKIKTLPSWAIHLSVIALFITYEVTLVYAIGLRSSLVIFIPYYILAITFFYTIAYVAMPVWKRKSFLVASILISALTLLHFTFITYIGNFLEMQKTFDFRFSTKSNKFRIIQNAYRSIYLLGLSIAYWLAKTKIEKQKEISLLKIKQLELENAYLRAQANPHLLFNMLTTLHNDIEPLAPKAAETLMQLTEIALYAYTPSDGDGKNALKIEIEQVDRYIRLQQNRYSDGLYINYMANVGHNNGTLRIPPLVLLTPVENIFKYGELNNPAHPVTIAIDCTAGALHLHTSNFKRKGNIFKAEHSTGLNNLKERLEHAYPNRYTLLINDTSEQFDLDLKVML